MVWGYIIGRSSAIGLKVNVNPYVLLFLAAIPDIDLLLGLTGIRHRTWTHSVLIWALVFTPFFIIYRKKSLPYFFALIQHVLFGDFVVGYYNSPLWPVYNAKFSLDYGLLSNENVVLETIGLGAFLSWVTISKGTRKQFFAKVRRNLWSILPIIPLAGVVIVALSGDSIINFMVENDIVRARGLLDTIPSITSNELFPFAIALHVILLSFLLVPLIQGIRSTFMKEISVRKT
jgi:hypothetical protein